MKSIRKYIWNSGDVTLTFQAKHEATITEHLRVEKMAQWVTGLLCKHVDLCSVIMQMYSL